MMSIMDMCIVCCCLEEWSFARRTSTPSDMLMTAVRRGNLASTKRLVNSYIVDVNFRDSGDGESPLYVAAQQGHFEIAKYLLKNGAAADMPDYNKETALFKATRRNSVEIVKLLIQNGANVNAINQWGDSCLLIACEYGYGSIVQCLLENNAVATIRNRKGETPLSVARICNYATVMDILAKHESSERNCLLE